MDWPTGPGENLGQRARRGASRRPLFLEKFMPVFKKILVPVDGSATSNKALDFALRLAQDEKASVRLLHCVDELSLLSSYEYSGELIQQARQAGQKILQDALAVAQKLGVAADTVMVDRVGQRLGHSVADAVGNWGADLVVVGSHGRRGIGRVLLGSGSEQILRTSPVPVLMVRGFD
jgi:nucleotide-binding universal stress UspA family protein